MKNNKIIIASIISVGAFALSLSALRKEATFNHAYSTDYEMHMNESATVVDNQFKLRTENGTEITMGASLYTADSSLGTLSQYGTIYNIDALNGLNSVSLSIISGSISIYTGWHDDTGIVYSSYAFGTLDGSSSYTYNLSSIRPSYFKLVANSETKLSAFSANYSCSENTKASFRFRVKAPLINGEDELLNSNYLFVNTNFEDVSIWSNYLMSKDSDGSFYYDFENITPRSSGYTVTLCLSDNDTAPNWGYSSTSINGYAVGVYNGQSELYISPVPAFNDQPIPAATTYSLTITVNISNYASQSGNIQFIYNYSNSTSDYTWNTYVTQSPSSTQTKVISGFDASRALYFKIYMWDGSHNIRVGDSNDINFVLVPTGNDTEDITVTFAIPASDGNVVGTYVNNASNPSSSMSFANQVTTVYGTPITINPTFDGDTESFTATYSGENIRIDNNKTIIGLKAGTSTTVTLNSENGLSCTFTVTVSSSTYSATATRDSLYASKEEWFTNTHTVNQINDMGSDFYTGMDISSVKALYDNGSKFYNESGVEQSLFYILKDAGVNWIRLKLWVDPESSDGISYGGGESNLDNTLWMAHEAKAAGMKFLLDFHYSDYWTDPTHQILPKAWASASSQSELATYIRNYTSETLTVFKNKDVLPDMVQLGNEISSGSFFQLPGSKLNNEDELDSNGEPAYDRRKTSAGNAISGKVNANQVAYINAAAQGVNDVDSNIKKVIHWAKGGTLSSSAINSFFSKFSSSSYDYAGLSLYPYYCFPDGISSLNSLLFGLSLSKPWFVAETSYPFSPDPWVYENDTQVTNYSINDYSGELDTLKQTYPLSITGQKDLIHDMTNSVITYGGKGIFYWEPAWIPNVNVGWAGVGSTCSWSNQGFFSLDGKVLRSLRVFSEMSQYF